MTHEMLTALFGWMVLIHMALLMLAALGLFALRGRVLALHMRLTGMPKDTLAPLYVQWLGMYKLLIFVFALVPWLALKLI